MSSQAPSQIKSILGANIKAARETKKLTQRQLAQRMSIDPQYVSRWERGLVQPNAGNVEALVVSLGVGMGWLYTDHTAEPVKDAA